MSKAPNSILAGPFWGGAYSASPEPLAEFKGPTSKKRGGEGWSGVSGGRVEIPSTFFCGSISMFYSLLISYREDCVSVKDRPPANVCI